jgi:membrane protein implicated in regulation of membrane protease activity
VTYAGKVYWTVGATGVLVVAAVILGALHFWWIAAVLAIVAVVAFLLAVRIAHSGTGSQRSELVKAGEQAIGAAGRAESGGWTPQRTERRNE